MEVVLKVLSVYAGSKVQVDELRSLSFVRLCKVGTRQDLTVFL